MAAKILLSGAAGRMGSEVLKLLPEHPQFELIAALESNDSKRLGEPSGIGRILFSADSSLISKAELVLDFSVPQGLQELLVKLEQNPKPLLVCSTGHSDETISRLKKLSDSVPVCLAANTSLGVFALHELSKLAQSILGSEFDIEIAETHHRMKKDSPSGTALSLARALSKDGELSVIESRNVEHAVRQPKEIAISSLRAGDVIGEHTVSFFGASERIEITHRAQSRALFARGALRLLSLLQKEERGFFSANQLYLKIAKTIS